MARHPAQVLDDLLFIFIDTVNKLQPRIVIMENVEGLIKGSAVEYALQCYSRFKKIGYKVQHYLLYAENMGVPQKRHRVFFIATRNDIDFDWEKLRMDFSYEHILFRDIKSGEGELNKESRIYELLSRALDYEKDFEAVKKRTEGRGGSFNNVIIHDNLVFPTLTAGSGLYCRFTEKTKCTPEDFINAQTFPQDYDFGKRTYGGVQYVCGMSVPPVMIKRIVERILQVYRKP